MPYISGTVGSTFVVTLDAGTILAASLHIPGAGVADIQLPFTDQTITVNPPNGLPNGPSLIRLAMDFAPGVAGANVLVSSVISGHAAAADPPRAINNSGLGAAYSVTMVGA